MRMNLRSLLAVVLLVSLAVVVLGPGCTSSEKSAGPVEDVTPQEAFALIQNNINNSDFIIIDIRTPVEFAGGHIESAINIDYYGETFWDDIGNLAIRKTYLIYCRTGNRSGQAMPGIEKLGFSKIYHLSDGIVAWNAEGLPVVQ